MKLSIPTPLQQEHEALHEELRRATPPLSLHAQTEEEVMYPAAVLVGRYLRQVLPNPSESRRAT